ncbi:hypothetical protein QQX13_05230 [Demequina sp. SYSU T00068]|uniref:hypothetical protein n=1 Tax=Demequina lignilytica TaxID=3051663 RepID=UPI002624E7D1|nr:hypothetical protein [Demequina sp. SYSU T00068]MDN4490228.1 hypothetical protein [Demequina sp. SYSU T00068]
MPQPPQPAEKPVEPPRAWWPVAVAAGVALLVVIGAVVVSNLRQGYSAGQADAVRACEDAYGAQAASGEAQPTIQAGDVYSAADWRDYYGLLRQQGALDSPVADLPEDRVAALDDAADALAAEGRDHVTVVWWLSSEEHLVCEVDVEGDRAVADSVALHPLEAPEVSETAGE